MSYCIDESVNYLSFIHNAVFLQVIGLSTVISSALIIPFLAMAAISSSAVNATASKYGYVRTMCTCGIAIIPIGMASRSVVLCRRALIIRRTGFDVHVKRKELHWEDRRVFIDIGAGFWICMIPRHYFHVAPNFNFC